MALCPPNAAIVQEWEASEKINIFLQNRSNSSGSIFFFFPSKEIPLSPFGQKTQLHKRQIGLEVRSTEFGKVCVKKWAGTPRSSARSP